MDAPTPLVVLGAARQFGSLHALEGVSFEVGRSELVGLLGPNGAGKTTLIRAIAGRLSLDRGRILLFGRELTASDPRADLGVVPQELAIYPLLSARENLEVFGRLYGVTGKALADRVHWALEWSDLKDRANEQTRHFSGGMKRRLNIACSLVHQPAVLLLDEPTVGVDPQSRERIYEMLGSLREAGMSIVLTTHHLEEAQERCQRVLIIDHGKIVAAGTVRDLVRQHLGGARTVRVLLSGALPPAAVLPDGVSTSVDRQALQCAVGESHVDADIASLARVAAAAGLSVRDVTVSGVSLQDVFIALTGRELRE